MSTPNTFGSVLNWSWSNYPDPWYGRMRATFDHVRRAAGYTMADGEPDRRKKYASTISNRIAKVQKNASRQMIVDAYEELVSGLICEVIALDKLSDANMVENTRQAQTIDRLHHTVQEAVDGQSAAVRRTDQVERQLEALLSLIAPEPEGYHIYNIRNSK